jgi:hypothetical protein
MYESADDAKVYNVLLHPIMTLSKHVVEEIKLANIHQICFYDCIKYCSVFVTVYALC